MRYTSSLAFKQYKLAVAGSLDVPVLESMPAYLESLPFAEGMELLSQAAWPCRLVDDGGRVAGFVMPAIPDAFFVQMRKSSGVSREAAEFQHLLNDDSFLARRQIDLSDRRRYELLAETTRALSVFHRHGIAVGDLSPKNLLFTYEPDPGVYFLDCDAMRFQGQSVMPQVETPGWEVRAVNPGEDLGTEASDSYKLGLLALRLLTGSQDRRDPARLPRKVPVAIRDLIAAALSADPARRPEPANWITPLNTAATAASTSTSALATAPATPAFTPGPTLTTPGQQPSRAMPAVSSPAHFAGGPSVSQPPSVASGQHVSASAVRSASRGRTAKRSSMTPRRLSLVATVVAVVVAVIVIVAIGLNALNNRSQSTSSASTNGSGSAPASHAAITLKNICSLLPGRAQDGPSRFKNVLKCDVKWNGLLITVATNSNASSANVATIIGTINDDVTSNPQRWPSVPGHSGALYDKGDHAAVMGMKTNSNTGDYVAAISHATGGNGPMVTEQELARIMSTIAANAKAQGVPDSWWNINQQ
jgi:hypothetical protein